MSAPELLSIGIATGGMSPANELVEEALASFARLVKRERGAFPNRGLRINIVFHVPGPISQPDYEGVHATRLDRKRQHLLVVAAVPASLRFDEVAKYSAGVLREARRQAINYIATRKVPLTLDNASSLIDHLLARIEVSTE